MQNRDTITTETHARALDATDPLAPFRERFYLPPNTIYMDGNSLGLLSRDAEAAVLHALEEWKRLAVGGWLGAEPDWFSIGEELGRLAAPLVGAEPDEVVVTGTTTVNLHALVATFYRPEGKRRKIVAGALDFPSDVYALASQIALKGGDPENDLVLVPSRDGRTLDEDDLIAAMTDEVALVLLPSVLYRSGQLLDMQRLTAAARERGIAIGFDCAHSVGAIPHRFNEWGVDFAFWCTYKYLNAGPGSTGGLYVNRRHFGSAPGLAGWWGYHKDRQFDMRHEWESAPGAGAWQISTPPILSTVPLLGTLRLFAEAGIDRVRAKSLKQTAYLVDLIEAIGLTASPYSYRVGTPREPDRRGGHVAVGHDAGARINRALKRRGVVPDFRPPDIVRLAPIALYTSYHEIWQAAQHLRDIIDTGEYLAVEAGRELVA
ncbi:MAG: kynureninase [Thermomicrobiales bacterium]